MFGVGLRSPTYKRFVRISYIIFFSFLSFTCYCIGINKLTIKSKCAILKHSFDNCKNLQEIIFPESMDYIESDAFKLSI